MQMPQDETASENEIPISSVNPDSSTSLIERNDHLLSPKRAKKLAKYIKSTVDSPKLKLKVNRSSGDISFKLYESLLLLLTQIGYLAVTASMLSTTFFEPSKIFCKYYNNTMSYEQIHSLAQDTHEFYSLLFYWSEICINTSWMIRISSAVMSGAVIGAFASGYLADSFGRKPVVVISLILLSTANITLSFFGHVSPYMATVIFFSMGCASGGYMVTNVVFVIEAVKTEKERLVVASLNGWPIGMVFTAVISCLCRDSRLYYMVTAATALVIATLLQFSSFESVFWLTNRNNSVKAARVLSKISVRNSKINLGAKKEIIKLSINTDIAVLVNENNNTKEVESKKSLSYLDLFKYSSIRRPLLTLLYCFLSSSVVSFGFYFNTDYLPGNRYLNLGMMGLLKFLLGLIPLLFSFLITKKAIILISVGLALLSCWTLVLITTAFQMTDSLIVTALGVMITATMDPTWKISHLYSVELFPTGVRNMARGACNVTARIGSMSGPLIILLRSYDPSLPYWLFASLLTFQWLLLALFMKSSSEDSLPEDMPVKEKNDDQKALIRV